MAEKYRGYTVRDTLDYGITVVSFEIAFPIVFPAIRTSIIAIMQENIAIAPTVQKRTASLQLMVG